MRSTQQIHFGQYDPVTSFGAGLDDDTFRRSDGSDTFSAGEWSAMSDHPDVCVLRKIAVRSIRGLQRVQNDETLVDLILNSLAFIDRYRSSTADYLATHKPNLIVTDWNGRTLEQKEAVSVILTSDDFDTINVTASIMRVLPLGEQSQLVPTLIAMYCALALKEVDAALLSLLCEGYGTASYAVVALDSVNAAEALERGDNIRQTTLSEWGRVARAKSLQEDPRQEEKKFVLECWREWRKLPDKYRSKAEFARDMIDKCEHLVSPKVIEDWCRAWEKNGSQPVG